MSDNPSTRYDPVDLWNRALPSVKENFVGYPLTKKTAHEAFVKRSAAVTSLSQLTPSNQVSFVRKLLRNWPYLLERRSIVWPLHVGILTNSITSTIIATRISADMFLMKANTPFFDAIRQCPKVPFVMAVYVSGLSFYGLHSLLVQKPVLKEGEICSSCVFRHSLLSAFLSGILLPMISSPYLSYYVLLQRGVGKYPLVTNYLEFLTLAWVEARAVAPALIPLIGAQFVVATISTALMLWGRSRLFATIEVEPDLVKEIMVKGNDSDPVRSMLENKLSNLPFWGRLVEDPSAET